MLSSCRGAGRSLLRTSCECQLLSHLSLWLILSPSPPSMSGASRTAWSQWRPSIRGQAAALVQVKVSPGETLNPSPRRLFPRCMDDWMWPWWAGGTLHGSPCHQCMNGWMATCRVEVLWVVGSIEKRSTSAILFSMFLCVPDCLTEPTHIQPLAPIWWLQRPRETEAEPRRCCNSQLLNCVTHRLSNSGRLWLTWKLNPITGLPSGVKWVRPCSLIYSLFSFSPPCARLRWNSSDLCSVSTLLGGADGGFCSDQAPPWSVSVSGPGAKTPSMREGGHRDQCIQIVAALLSLMLFFLLRISSPTSVSLRLRSHLRLTKCTEYFMNIWLIWFIQMNLSPTVSTHCSPCSLMLISVICSHLLYQWRPRLSASEVRCLSDTPLCSQGKCHRYTSSNLFVSGSQF